jgi:hypothetical protein
MKSMISAMLVAVLIIAIGSAATMTNIAAARTVTANGFTFDSPTGWKVKDKENRFADFEETLDYSHGGKSGHMVIEHDDVFTGVDTDRLETVLGMVYPDSSVFESNSDKYFVNNQSAPYVIAKVTKTNLFGFEHEFVVMAVAVQLNDDDAVLVQYSADKSDFDKLLGQVEGIIQTIAPTTVA